MIVEKRVLMKTIDYALLVQKAERGLKKNSTNGNNFSFYYKNYTLQIR